VNGSAIVLERVWSILSVDVAVSVSVAVAVFRLQLAELRNLSLASAQVWRICDFCVLDRG
jgi:hypothetical protein